MLVDIWITLWFNILYRWENIMTFIAIGLSIFVILLMLDIR